MKPRVANQPSPWRWLLLALWLLVAGLIMVTFIQWVGLGGQPLFGYWDAIVTRSDQPFVARIVGTIPEGAASLAGIRDGDRVDLRKLDLYDRVALIFQPATTRAPDLTVMRGGRTFAVRVHPSTLFGVNSAWKIWPSVLAEVAGLALMGCALILVLRRSSKREGRYLCATLLAFVGAETIGYGDVASTNGAVAALAFLAGGCFNCAAAGLPVAMAARFGKRTAWRRVAEAAAGAVVLLGLAGYVAGTIGMLTLAVDPLPFVFGNWRLIYVAMFAMAVVNVWLAVAGTERSERPRAGWLLLPLPVAMLVFAVLSQFTTSAPSWAGYMICWAIAFAAMLAGAIAVTYALLMRRVLDVQFVIGRTLVVGGVSAIVVVSFVLLEWLLGTVLANASHATGLAANAGLALVLGLSMSFIHKRVDSFVDFAFFHRRHENERALRDFANEAAFVTRPNDLLDRTIEVLRSRTDATSAAIVLDGDGMYRSIRWFGDASVDAGENDALILALKAKHVPLDPHDYHTALTGDVALPMLVRGRLLGTLLCGRRAGGEGYAPDEVEALSQLARAVASALDALSASQGSSSDAILARIEALLKELVTRA